MTDTVETPAPRRRRRLWRWLLIGAVGLAAFIAILVTVVFSLTQPVVDRGDAFMGALRGGNFEQAYSLSTPSLQQELGSAQGLAARIGTYRPTEWSWSQRSIRNGVGRVEGSATYQDGRRGTARLVFFEVDDEWRVASFALN